MHLDIFHYSALCEKQSEVHHISFFNTIELNDSFHRKKKHSSAL